MDDGQQLRALHWVRAHPGAALSAAGLVSYGVVGFAYLSFYDRLGVGVGEVGLGYTEILSQAAFGLGAWLVLFALYGTVMGLFNLGLMRLPEGRRPSAPTTTQRSINVAANAAEAHPRWFLAIVIGGGAAVVAFPDARSWVVTAGLGVAMAGSWLGMATLAWRKLNAVRELARNGVRPDPIAFIVVLATVQLVSLVAMLIVGLDERLSNWLLIVLGAVLVMLFVLATQYGRLVESSPRWVAAVRSGNALAIAAGLVVVTMFAVGWIAGRADAENVAEGRAYSGVFSSFTHGRVDCVEVDWTEAPGELGARVLYLGHGPSLAVFYDVPSQSVLRVPTSSFGSLRAVDLAVPDERCS